MEKIQDNVQDLLYSEAKGSGPPISYQIASRLLENRDGRVAVVTGTYDPVHLPGGETDGPIGAVVLARALQILGYDTSVLIDETISDVLSRFAGHIGFTGDVVDLSVKSDDANTDLADDYNMAIFVEKLGSNSEGIQHSTNGLSCDGNDAKVDGFASRMLDNGAFTAGLGDGGNEIGFGLLYDAVQERVPYGKECRCPCGGGIATTAKTEVVFPAGTSNWAAYAVIGALACLEQNPLILHTPQMEKGLLRLAASLGCNDGSTGTARPYLDGVPTTPAASVVELMRCAVEQAFTSWGERPF